MIDISVIILNWNGKRWLKDCYGSLRGQTFKNFEAILVDNGSSDGSCEYTERFFPEVKIIRFDKNLGYSEANNRAARKAMGRYLLFLNNDTRLEHNCLEELMEYVGDTRKDICSVRFLDYNSATPDASDKIMGMGVDMFGYPLPSEKIFYSEGAAFFINKELFGELNGFDEKHFIFAEDIDLSWRAQLQGHTIGFVRSARVYHEKGATIVGSSRKAPRHITSINRRYLTERNTLRNLLKNYGLATLIIVLPIHVLVLVAEMVFFLFRRKVKVARDVYLKALLFNMVNLSDTLRERKKIQRERIVSDSEILKRITLNKFYKWEVFKKMGVPIVK